MSSDKPENDAHPDEHHSPQPPAPPPGPDGASDDYYLDEARGCIRGIFPGLFLKSPEPAPLQRSRASGPPPRREIAWARVAGLVAVAAVAALAVGWCVVSRGSNDDGTPANSGFPVPGASASAAASPSGSPATGSPSPRASVSPSTTPTGASPSATTTGATPGQATATKAPPTNTPPPGSTSTPVPPTATTAPPTSTPTNTPIPPTATPAITNFAGSWHSATACDNPAAPWRWSVALSQSGAAVSGSITFHACPGGGIAAYSVSGTATSASTVSLQGAKTTNLGGLGGSTPNSVTFTIAKNGPPDPNYAP